MTLQEFKLFCENRADLKELWENLVINALNFREQQISVVLKMRQEDTVLLDKEIVLLRELEYDFIRAKNELCDVCARNNITTPPFTLNKVCDLYA